MAWGFSVERVTGIEPALSAWEAEVLPLNYTRAVHLPVHQAPNTDMARATVGARNDHS